MEREKEIEVNDELIVKYLSGEASPEQALTISDWLREPNNKVRFDQFESTWNSVLVKKKPTFDTQPAWNKIDDSIKAPHTIATRHVHVAWWSTKAFRIAASLLFVTVTAVLVTMKFSDNTKYLTTSSQSGTSHVTLSDQSHITLFRFTTLTYPDQFNKNVRQVNFVKGEAFFQVTHDDQKPFMIHTSAAEIKVVGTEFNVAVTNDQVEVSVKEGKVLVYSAGDSLYLTAGMTGVFQRGKKLSVDQNLADNNVWSYATRKLTFKDTPLSSVIRDIERTYDCSISIAGGDISKCKLTATFDNDSVDKIINLIAETLSLGVKRNGEVFILEGEGCP